MRKFFSCLIAISLLMTLFSGCGKQGERAPGPEQPAASDRWEGSGFDSGEAAALAALEAIRDSDVQALLACYAVETFADRFRFDDYYSYEDYPYLRPTECYLPEGTGFSDTFNYWQRRFAVTCNAGQSFVCAANGCFEDGLVLPDGVSGFPTHYYGLLSDPEQTDAYLAALGEDRLPQRLAELRITGAVFDITQGYEDQLAAKDKQSAREESADHNLREARRLGADQVRDYGVPVSVGGCDCLFTVQTVCYGGSWFVLQLGSSRAAMGTMAGGFALEAPGGKIVSGSDAAGECRVSDRILSLDLQGKGFDASEAAAVAYVDGLARLDLPALVSAACCDDYADKNVLLHANHTIQLDQTPYFGGSRYTALGRGSAAESVVTAMLINYLTLAASLNGSEASWSAALPGASAAQGRVPTRDRSDGTGADVRAALQSWLADPEIQRAVGGLETVSVARILDEDDNEIAARFAGLYGAEHYAVDLVTATLAGQTWYVWVESVCLNGRWYTVPSGWMASLAGSEYGHHFLHN